VKDGVRGRARVAATTSTEGYIYLDRFVEAQRSTYAGAIAELRDGRKRSHWMWYVFPQLAGLGRSAMSERYAIATLAEAEGYLRHPILGPRLIECTSAVLEIESRSAREIFGSPDDMKLRSCATLFELVSAPDSPFARVLAKYFRGERDEQTLRLLGRGA
jgi:uncharacterized protein (DUF1810 family)